MRPVPRGSPDLRPPWVGAVPLAFRWTAALFADFGAAGLALLLAGFLAGLPSLLVAFSVDVVSTGIDA